MVQLVATGEVVLGPGTHGSLSTLFEQTPALVSQGSFGHGHVNLFLLEGYQVYLDAFHELVCSEKFRMKNLLCFGDFLLLDLVGDYVRHGLLLFKLVG